MPMSYDEVVRDCQRNRKLFEDPDFTTTNENLFFSRAPPRPFEWKRPKEIVSDPKFIVGGASRLDVQMGYLENSWLLSAISSLTMYEKLLERVVDPSQNFDGPNYCGAFRFNIWHEGDWKEVVVDDRLPTYNGKLVFVHCAERNEFWTPLLEKAFAKLAGSYEALKGGQGIEAMTDLTSGVSESYKLGAKAPANLHKIMLQAFNRSSLMTCSIEAGSNEVGTKGPSGLTKGTHYSVTKVVLVKYEIRSVEKKIDLVRLRNPWGTKEREWTGAFSDNSREWGMIPDDEKAKIGLKYGDDGEFWMTSEDFIKNFSLLEICNLEAQAVTDNNPVGYEIFIDSGRWIRGSSAGGCRNFLQTFATNPQYRVTLTDPDTDDDDKCSLVVAVMQKESRKLKEKGKKLYTIGFSIYKVPDEGFDDKPLDMQFFQYNASSARSPEFLEAREVTGRYLLDPGTYAVIPSTFNPNEQGEFLIRIFSEKETNAKKLDNRTSFRPQLDNEDDERYKVYTELDQKFLDMFKKLAGPDLAIDAGELEQILSSSFKAELDGKPLGFEAARIILSMSDNDNTGKLEFEEFKELWNMLRRWRRQFASYDVDGSEDLERIELRGILAKQGYQFGNEVLNLLAIRYGNRGNTLAFKDVIVILAKLYNCQKNFNAFSLGYREMNIDEFMMAFVNT